MKIKHVVSCLFLGVVVLLSSCEKEKELQHESPGSPSGNNNPSITGQYDLVGIVGITRAEIVVGSSPASDSSITLSHFIGKNVKGGTTITSNKMNFSNMSYLIDTVAYLEYYIDGILEMGGTAPYYQPIAPFNSSASYKWNRSDSLTLFNLSGGIADQFPGPNQGTVTEMGANVSWAGDTLSLNMYTPVNNTIIDPVTNMPAALKGFLRTIMRFKRK